MFVRGGALKHGKMLNYESERQVKGQMNLARLSGVLLRSSHQVTVSCGVPC